MARPHIRWMIRRDMPEVLAIEATTPIESWSESVFLTYLRQRNCFGVVAEQGETIVGFMVYLLHRRYIELLNFHVRADWQGCGVGRSMFEKLTDKLSARRRPELVFTVNEHLDQLHYFLKAMGCTTSLERGAFGLDDGYRFVFEKQPEKRESSATGHLSLGE